MLAQIKGLLGFSWVSFSGGSTYTVDVIQHDIIQHGS